MAENVGANVQAGAEISYELQTLGWKAFQQLCLTVVGDVWGNTVQGFVDSHDGGRDGAFWGKVKEKEEELKGSFTVQCKFTAHPHKTLQLENLTDEIGKASKLVSKGLADHYFLMTNYAITGTSEEEIREAFLKINGLKSFRVYGKDRISALIRESPRLRMMVPRVYGIGDLSQILDERALTQSKEILSSLGDELQKFVITDAYRKSAKAILEQGFVLLIGEPACGKSAIATALAMGALDNWECQTFKIQSAQDFREHWNPHETKQFFWADDVFGATQLDWASVNSWNSVLPEMRAAIKRGAKFVFTSRDYIFNGALNGLKTSDFPGFLGSQVVIKVEEITQNEKEQILYNHIKLGDQDFMFKRQIKPHLLSISKRALFKPETARRLGNRAFTKRLAVTENSLNNFVDKPTEALMEIIRTLDPSSRAALGLVFLRGGLLESPFTLSETEEKILTLLGNPKEIYVTLKALKGSFLVNVLENSTYHWKFKHPTIRDAFATLISETPDLMEMYITGTPLNTMFGEVTCGDINLKGVKLVVPPNQFNSVIKRIISDQRKNRIRNDSVNYFLTRRVTKDFLSTYLEMNPTFLTTLKVDSYLGMNIDLDLIIRLYEFKILPEEKRKTTIEQISAIAITYPDSGFLSPKVKQLFTEEEFTNLCGKIENDVIYQLPKVLANLRREYPDQTILDHYDDFESALGDFRVFFQGDIKAEQMIKYAFDSINEHKEKFNDDDDYQRWEDSDPYSRGRSDIFDSDRSVFDDVDE